MACSDTKPDSRPQLDRAETVAIQDTAFMSSELALLVTETPDGAALETPEGFGQSNAIDEAIEKAIAFANAQPILTGIIVLFVAKKIL